MSKTISLITYSDLPGLDPDDHLLQAALQRRGCFVQGLVWDEASIDWSNSGICVLRSTWDYHLKFDEFCRWLNHVDSVTTLMNSKDLVLWNCKKTYLQDLSRAGLPVIPTRFVSRDACLPLEHVLAEMGWTEAIIKPAIGLATSGVMKIDAGRESLLEAENHLQSLLQNSDVMIQEYMPSVHDYGERSLVFIDGVYSHCVRKSAFQKLAIAGHAGESAASAAEDEIAIARDILSFLKVTPLYARVDLVRDRRRHPLLMELELVEPSLFLSTCPQAAEPFAEAILQRCPCAAF